MPTERVLSPHRILPLVLTIPVLLLFAATGSRPGHGPDTPSRAAVQNRFERHAVPAGWDDDAIKDAFPAPLPDDDEPRRKIRVARTILHCEPSAEPPFRRPVWDMTFVTALDSLMESLRSGRPPPSSPAQT
jgi:hypothetical protein